MQDNTVSSLMNTYARADLTLERGEGVWLWGNDGRKYLDFYAGIAVNALGHGHPHLLRVLQKQMHHPWHVTNMFRIPEGERLAHRLCSGSFADKVFFTNSGVEALEGLIKLTRRYFYCKGNPKKHRIITFSGAFHGRSLTTTFAANNPKYVEGCGPRVSGFDTVPFGDADKLRAAITEETAGILLEPIQGEGGICEATIQYLQDLRSIADESDLLLLLDEVQSGNGRTGKMWAHEWANIQPDVLATAKGLGGGFPLGAILASEEAASGMVPGIHGSTFGGNPMAMAVGNGVLDILESEGFLDNVRHVGNYLKSGLLRFVQKYPTVFRQVRGRGLMLGLQCHETISAVDMVKALREEGLLTVGGGENVVRILPPLIITKEECVQGLSMIESRVEKLVQAG